MGTDYKTRIYESYTSNQVSQIVNLQEMEAYYKTYDAYFKRNYLPFMPADKDAVMIDVGCGIGCFLNFAKKHGYTNVIGIDISKENVSFCEKMGFNVKMADARTYLNERDKEFSLVVFNEVIEHLEKQEVFDMLDAMKHSLKENGILLIKTPNMSNPYISLTSRYSDFTHTIGFTEISLKQVLNAVGFSEVNIVGTDIYVFNPLVNVLAGVISKLVCLRLYLTSYLFGRKYVKIFQKNLLAIARK